ncbi:ec81 protein [Colletotrichum incanum]|nr:ec81 protein [Colletotrichum incanum]
MSTGQIDSISVSLVTFADEVIDISGISFFGNINDGLVDCTVESETGNAALIGPVPVSGNGLRQINLSLVTFADEVIDFSNIAIFGDVNDSGCE